MVLATKEQLERWYIKEELSIPEIATKLGCARSGVGRWMDRFSISRRTLTESQAVASKHGKFLYRKNPERNNNWKGGRFETKQGYIMVYNSEHPRANQKHIFEHIIVWENVHNQRLPRGWVVHHLNGIKSDNRPENLAAMPLKRHSIITHHIPYKQRIRELEVKIALLEKALRDSQIIFGIGEN